MAYTDKIRIEIESIFDSDGFKRAQRSMDALQSDIKNLASAIPGASKAMDKAQRSTDKMSKSMEKLSDRMGIGKKFRAASSKVDNATDKMGASADKAREKIEQLKKVGLKNLGKGMARAGRRSNLASLGLNRMGLRAQKGNSRQGALLAPMGGKDPIPWSQGGQRMVNNLGNRFNQASDKAKNFGNTLRSKTTRAIGRGSKAAGGMATKLGSVATGFGRGSDQAGDFRFDLLGLMFAGMALQRVMFGLLRPAMKAVGVFDLFSTALKILFLPVALDALQWVIDFMDWVGSLDNETKSMIGRLTLLAGALGTVLLAGGQLGLALQSLMLFIGNLTSIMSILSFGGFVALLGAAAVAAGVLTAEGENMTQKWENFTDQMSEMLPKVMEWTSDIASEATKFLGKLWIEFTDWFNNKDWSKFWYDLFDWNSDKNFDSWFNSFTTKFGKLMENERWSNMWESMFKFTGSMSKNTSKFTTDIINKMADKLAKNKNNIWGKIFNFDETVKSGIARFMGQVVGTIVDTIADIDWSKVFKAALTGQEIKNDRIGATRQSMGMAFMEGYTEATTEPTMPSAGFSGQQAMNTLNNSLQVDITMDEDGNVKNKDIRQVNRVYGQGSRNSTPQRGAGN